jgi:hypothetical protein
MSLRGRLERLEKQTVSRQPEREAPERRERELNALYDRVFAGASQADEEDARNRYSNELDALFDRAVAELTAR